MAAQFGVAVEAGFRKSFAQSCDWPGFCRSGRTEAEAISNLVAYGPRFHLIAIGAGAEFKPPTAAEVRIVERLEGGPVTDFGAITTPIVSDRDPLTPTYRDLVIDLLRTAWAAFDGQLQRIPPELRESKPRVGRSPAAMRLHLLETDDWHSSAFGGSYRKPPPEVLLVSEADVRQSLIEQVGQLPLGQPFLPIRRYGLTWTPVFAARRSIWHALDHAWQLEDSTGAA